MTNSSTPQSASTKAPSVKSLSDKYAEKMAAKIVKSNDNLEKFAATKSERAATPKSPQEIKEFFEKKKAIAAARSPEEKAAATKAFYARKAEQKAAQEKTHFDALSANPAFSKKSETELHKIAAFRMDFAKEIKGLPENKIEKSMLAFDKKMSADGSMAAIESKAKESAKGIVAERSNAKSNTESMSL